MDTSIFDIIVIVLAGILIVDFAWRMLISKKD